MTPDAPSDQRCRVTRHRRNPWLDIPLAEYEGHMSFPAVGQAQMLADQFAAILVEYAPSAVAVAGCAGGNGFDRVLRTRTHRVVGIDINPRYIECAARRYAALIPGLELYSADIQASSLRFAPVDLLYAALIFEHVEPAPTLRTLKSWCKPGGILAVVLQLPSAQLEAVSPSPFTAVQSLAPAMRLVPTPELQAQAMEAGFGLASSRVIALPSGKQFAMQVFRA